jgi:hypothetical protein
MPTWEELLKNRTVIPSVRNSGHMLECVRIVKERHPNARIVTVADGKQWQLAEDGKYLSNPRPSHYECWLEARMIQEQLG